jgi:regulatory protein
MLARRDRASGELGAKLRDLGYDAGVAQAVVERLIAEKLVDDHRYVDNFLRYHASRGQGPLRIRQELRQAGLAGPLVEDAIAAHPDWIRGARNARIKKFGVSLPAAPAERARQMRFLGYRGFTSAEIRAALGWDVDTGVDEAGADGDDL